MGFGAYGKIPALGDFFRASPPPGFAEAWDPWLQERLLDIQGEMGTTWRTAYLGAPIWRFTLHAGIAGPAPILGVLMPSVDRVGRDFPLTLMAQAAGSAFGLHGASEATFAALEEAALGALAEGATLDELTDALKDIAVPFLPETRILADWPGHLALSGAAASPALLDATVKGWAAPSVWSAALESGTRTFVIEGLPGKHHARALFDLDAPFWQTGAELEVPL